SPWMSIVGAAMSTDYTVFLWLLKLGALVNLYLLARTPAPSAPGADPPPLRPPQIFFAVSLYRWLLPVRYEHTVAVHDSGCPSTRGGCSRRSLRSSTSTSSRVC